MTVWLIRAGSHGDQESLALDNGIACVGWDEVGDLSLHQSVDAIATLLRAAKPQDSEPSILNQARQLHACAHRIQQNDLIVLPLKSRSQIAFGRANGPYRDRPELGSGAMHTHGVRWVRTDVPRTSISRAAGGAGEGWRASDGWGYRIMARLVEQAIGEAGR